jgi:hypothetical protein
MPIDIEHENVVSLTEATTVMLPVNGRRPSITTLWRWCRFGLNGVQLEYIRVGRSIATSTQALGRFFETLAKADRPLPQRAPAIRIPNRTPNALRRASLEAADRVMEELGVRKAVAAEGGRP